MKFPNFLIDIEQYDAAELYWSNLFEEFNLKLSNQEKWKPWFEGNFANGLKRRDGNPIFTRWESKTKRAIRVIQEEPECAEDEFAIGAWMSQFDDEIDELVISCVLSDKTEKIIQQLIEAYVLRKFSNDEMKVLISELNGSNSKTGVTH